ncbi:MAG TPA: hypothetical protein VIV34_11165 [Pseudolabrys sp.]
MQSEGMRRLALLAAAGAMAALAGCATEVGPTSAELKARWDAANVFPQGYRQDLLAYLRTYLNDPSHVRGAAVSQPQLKFIGPGDRYVACVRFNARNTDGKYLGSKDGAAVYVAGKLDRFFDVPKDVRELCKDAVFAPFPELERLTR